jgi:radical SAM superfamily enzyme YgiQ (UPF0313 family)
VNKIQILLGTLNSTYQHSSFGLRYLFANMGALQEKTQLLEWTIKENPRNIVEKILQLQPRIVGLSVYIWNTNETLEVIKILKKVAPEIIIVLGGPEISYETSSQEHIKWCDFVIQGEADFAFREFCENILLHDIKPTSQIMGPTLPDVKTIALPYSLYSDSDIQNRVIYVEASRGCPYKCEYCLSSLDKSVRNFTLEPFLAEMKLLLDRGARTFKFVDRTFNLSPTTSIGILQFFLEHIELGLFLHFELVPDRLPAEIREIIQKFPAGSLQFEVGIQTLNPEVAKNVSRKNDLLKVAENFQFIREQTHVHTHADLIVGLPGESLDSFAEGFDRLALMGPDEIQVGILKRLKGTPIARHEKTFQMVYSEDSPYQILRTSTLDYLTLQKMNRFAKFWDLYANSGEFKNFMLWFKNDFQPEQSFFWRFFEFSDYLNTFFQDTHSISLMNLSEKAYRFLIAHKISDEVAASLIEKDFCFGAKRRDLPPFLKNQNRLSESGVIQTKSQINRRQINHLS